MNINYFSISYVLISRIELNFLKMINMNMKCVDFGKNLIFQAIMNRKFINIV